MFGYEQAESDEIYSLNSFGGKFVSLETFKWWKPPRGWAWLEFVSNYMAFYYGDISEKEKKFVWGLFPLFGVEKEVVYKPHLENNALFIEFLNLKLTRESLNSFVTKWGPLVWPEQSYTFHIKDEKMAKKLGIKLSLDGNIGLDDPEGNIASLSYCLYPLQHLIQLWLALIKNKKDLTNIWIKKRDNKLILKNVFYGGEGVTSKNLEFSPSEFRNQFEGYFDGILPHFRDLENCEIARLYLVKNLNSLPINLKVGLREKTKPTLFLSPNNLFEFIYLQFLLAVTGCKNFRQCKICETWFEIERDKRKSKRIYCTKKCKQAAWRAKKS